MKLLNRFFILREVLLRVRDLVKRNAELRARAERAELQLAGCSAAALGWDLDSRPGDHGWSAAYGDVVKIRRELEAARSERDAIMRDFQIEGDDTAYDVVRRLNRAATELRASKLIFRGSASDLATDVVALLTLSQREEFLKKFHAWIVEAS